MRVLQDQDLFTLIFVTHSLEAIFMRIMQVSWADSLHQIINYVKDKIGVVFLRSCVIFDTL